jgi:hypothetical protein
MGPILIRRIRNSLAFWIRNRFKKYESQIRILKTGYYFMIFMIICLFELRIFSLAKTDRIRFQVRINLPPGSGSDRNIYGFAALVKYFSIDRAASLSMIGHSYVYFNQRTTSSEARTPNKNFDSCLVFELFLFECLMQQHFVLYYVTSISFFFYPVPIKSIARRLCFQYLSKQCLNATFTLIAFKIVSSTVD